MSNKMGLSRCEHCRYLFEGTGEVCPACGRPLAAGGAGPPPDDNLDDRKTIKLPTIKRPSPEG